MKKKVTRTSAKKKAWKIFSEYVRLRDALKTTGTKTHVLCITCEKRYPAFGKGCAQAGHFIPGRGNSVLIDPDFVHAQCYNCNINLRGNWIVFEEKMIAMHGAEEVAQAKRESKQPKIFSITEWQELEEFYKQAFELLNDRYLDK